MIETERLILRGWRESDIAAHRAVVTDPRVVATLGGPPPAAMSAEVVERQNAILDAYGYCFWAVDHRADRRFVGWCGIKPGEPPIEGETEIGWALHPVHWGRGLAREAAAAVLDWAWANTALTRILAITTPGNLRSWRLMERLGMHRVPDGDFDHPALEVDDPLRPHLTYEIRRSREAPRTSAAAR